MTVNTAGGSKLYIGTTQQATSQAAFEGDSYVEVGSIEDMGEIGDESQEIQFTTLADSRTQKFKGPRDAGTMQVVVGDDMTDAGQDAMVAAEASPLNYNFKITLNDPVTTGGTPTVIYFRARVMSKRRNIGNVSNVVRRTFNLGVNSATIEVDPT